METAGEPAHGSPAVRIRKTMLRQPRARRRDAPEGAAPDRARPPPNGMHVAMAAANGPFWSTTVRSVYIAAADGLGFRRVGPRGNIWDAVWSPDGRWIAFSMASRTTNGLFELYLMHPDGSGVRQLTPATDGLFSEHPTRSPDSDQLVFVRGTNDVHLTNIWRSTSTAHTRTRSRTNKPNTEPAARSHGCRDASPHSRGDCAATSRSKIWCHRRAGADNRSNSFGTHLAEETQRETTPFRTTAEIGS